jgi:hypothetical protein
MIFCRVAFMRSAAGLNGNDPPDRHEDAIATTPSTAGGSAVHQAAAFSANLFPCPGLNAGSAAGEVAPTMGPPATRITNCLFSCAGFRAALLPATRRPCKLTGQFAAHASGLIGGASGL